MYFPLKKGSVSNSLECGLSTAIKNQCLKQLFLHNSPFKQYRQDKRSEKLCIKRHVVKFKPGLAQLHESYTIIKPVYIILSHLL